MSATEVVGRDAELRVVADFVERIADSPAMLVLEGEPGIGKTTLWQAAVAAALGRDLTVLSSRSAEAERDLPNVGLGDLLDGVPEDVTDGLSPPRRRALEVALLREEASGERYDHRALAVAVRDVVGLLSEQKPVLIAIDDAHWLDASTEMVLTFLIRRLDGPVGVVLTRRLRASELEHAVRQGFEVERLRVGPVSVGALHKILHDQLGRLLARPTLLRIHGQSGGNPFFALEIARALKDDVDPFEPLPVPGTLEGLVRSRLDALPAATREALAFLAALGTPSESFLGRLGATAGLLTPAISAQVVELDGGQIRFTHPLLASLVYRDLGRQRRRIVHARIAEMMSDPVQRARHLARASEGPDAGVALALDAAATTAMARGASASAAELAEAALRLTPHAEVDTRRHRALAAARAHRACGGWERARDIAVEMLGDSGLGALRAETLMLLAELEGLGRAVALLEDALRESSSRPVLRSAILCRLAWSSRFSVGYERALEHGRAAMEIADAVGDNVLRVEALEVMAFLGSAVGDPDTGRYAQRALDIATGTGNATLLHKARGAMLQTLRSSDHDAARELLHRDYEDVRQSDEVAAADVLHDLAWTELWAGNWQLAATRADQAFDLMTQYGLETPWAHLPIAMVAAHRGQLGVARAHSERALLLGEEQFEGHTPVHLGTLGFVALQSGDPTAATRWFARADDVTTRLGWRNAGRRWWVPDQVEALLTLGRGDEAVQVLDRWEAERQNRDDRSLGHITRCRGLVAASRAELEEADALLTRAIAQHEQAADPFGRARALLALGGVRRRERQKRAARDAINSAREEFRRLGAAAWLERAGQELGRLGGRTREEGLTPAERRVAALVASGRTNREVAALLFVGERTVETHLAHVYAKLGVRSRTELARTYEPDDQSSGKPTIPS